MKNISNQGISSEKCTKCNACGKPSWYIMQCDCGHIFCKNCSVSKSEQNIIILECLKCGETQLYV